MKKPIIVLIFFISYLYSGLNASQQSLSTESPIDPENIVFQIKKQQQVIDSLKHQLSTYHLEVEKAEKLINYSDEIYSRTKDSITMSDRIINFFIAIIAFIATLSGISIIQSWHYRKKLKLEAQQKVAELSIINEEQITTAAKELNSHTKQTINDLAKKHEEQLNQQKIELLNISNQKIAELAQSNEETIKNMISKHNKEQFLLENSKILIINKSDTAIDNGLEMILKRFKSELTIINTLDFSDIELSNLKLYDAVILDNVNYNDDSKNWNFHKEHFDNLLRITGEICSNNGAFLFFGRNDGELSKKLPGFAHLINYANQSATLFANLIDLLDYRRLLNSKP